MEQKIDIQAIRKETIDKCCEWMDQHYDDRVYWGSNDEGDFLYFYEFIADLKKAMTEQK